MGGQLPDLGPYPPPTPTSSGSPQEQRLPGCSPRRAMREAAWPRGPLEPMGGRIAWGWGSRPISPRSHFRGDTPQSHPDKFQSGGGAGPWLLGGLGRQQEDETATQPCKSLPGAGAAETRFPC